MGYKEMCTREVGSMGISVVRLSAAAMRDRKRAIRRELRMSERVLRERARAFELDAHERALAREYERLEFLARDAS